MNVFKRLLAFLLCACLLMPGMALAEGGVRFSLAFQASPSPDPALTGLTDLLDCLTLEGTFEGIYTDNVNYSGFDLHTDLMLEGSERTRTDLFLYGYAGMVHVRSSRLLGEGDVKLNMPALVEFGVKMNSHMGIPLHRLALLNPYATTSAFRNMDDLWDPVLFAGEGSRTIPKGALLSLAEAISASSLNDPSFYYWVTTLGEVSGADEILLGLIDQMPQWIEENVPESGLQITVEDGRETWTLGDTVIVTASENALTIDLPSLPDETTVSLSWQAADGGAGLTLYADISQADVCLLHLAATGLGLPTALPISSPFTLSVLASGILLGEQGFDLSVHGDGQDGRFTMRVVAGGITDNLVISGTLVPYTPDALPSYDRAKLEYEGTNVFSLNDVTLSEFVGQVAKPFVTGVIPLIAHMPASVCVSLMDMLEQGGVFDLIASGAGFGGDIDGDEAESLADDLSGEGGNLLDTSMYDEDDWDFDDDDWDFSGQATAAPADRPSSAPDDEYEEDDWDF